MEVRREAKPVGSGPGTRSRVLQRPLVGPFWGQIYKGRPAGARGAFPCKTPAHCQGAGTAGNGAALGTRVANSATSKRSVRGAEEGAWLGDPQREASRGCAPSHGAGNSLVALSCHRYAGGRAASSPSPWGGGPPCPCPHNPAQGPDPQTLDALSLEHFCCKERLVNAEDWPHPDQK